MPQSQRCLQLCATVQYLDCAYVGLLNNRQNVEAYSKLRVMPIPATGVLRTAGEVSRSTWCAHTAVSVCCSAASSKYLSCVLRRL